MKLLIDAGNTRIKWAVIEKEHWLIDDSMDNESIESARSLWAAWPITKVWVASVAGAVIDKKIQQALPVQNVVWVKSQKMAFGLYNAYENVLSQGVDRWLAVVAAHQRFSGDLIVACAGTALTVEAVTASGHYLGGLIMPGMQLMLKSLADNTAQLNRSRGLVQAFPTNTEDALSSGAVVALTSAIETQRQKLKAHTGSVSVNVVLTGGDALQLQPWLEEPVEVVDNLTLLGLLKVANHEMAFCSYSTCDSERDCRRLL